MNIKPKPSPAIDSLKAYPNWVCWKDGKIPTNPHTGNYAKANDSSTWGTYQQAVACFKRGGMEGLSFMFDDNAGIVGVDLDNKPDPVFDENGELCEWARDIVSSLNSYTEVSPSGNGLHILCKGVIPSALASSADHGVEMYGTKKAFTMTGMHLPFTPDTINDSQAALTQLHAKYKPQRVAATNNVTSYSAAGDVPSTDEVASMLSRIPLPMGYEEWVKVCMSVHSAYPNNTGIDMLLNWSEKSFKEGENPRKILEGKFKSFSGSAVGIGTLVYHAKKNGYETQRKEDIPNATAKPQDTITITVEELEKIKDKEYWRGYHDGMTAAQLQTWLNLGVPEFMVNEWGLGYNESIVDKTTGEFLGEGVSIPIFNKGGELQNIEYRTTEGKIHYEVNRPALFNPEKKLTGTIIIIPDNIDTMTAWTKAGHIEIGGERVTFLGLPLCKIDEQAINELSEAEHIYVMLGNDTKTDGRGMGVLKNKARFTRLPCTVSQAMAKIDDVKMKRILSSAQI